MASAAIPIPQGATLEPLARSVPIPQGAQLEPLGGRPDFAQNPPSGVTGPSRRGNQGQDMQQMETLGSLSRRMAGGIAGMFTSTPGAVSTDDLAGRPNSGQDVTQGLSNINQPGKRVRGTTQLLRAGVDAATPLMGPAVYENPVGLLKVMAGSGVGQQAGQLTASAFDASPDEQELAGYGGGLVGAMGASRISNPTAVRLAKTGGGALWGGAKDVPVLKGVIRGGIDAWNANAPPPTGPPTLESDTGLQVSNSNLVRRMGGVDPATISDRPSGRFVLGEGEWSANDQQMSLLKKMASQRGTQFAAGVRPAQSKAQ
jgi:hypothetical protein